MGFCPGPAGIPAIKQNRHKCLNVLFYIAVLHVRQELDNLTKTALDFKDISDVSYLSVLV